jgi:hypothetical protein
VVQSLVQLADFTFRPKIIIFNTNNRILEGIQTTE